MLLVHLTPEDLLSRFIGGLSSNEIAAEVSADPSLKSIVLTSYLPSYERGPFGGIECLKALRVAGTTDPAVMFSFHSYDTLTARPENGILLEEGCSYVRLPTDLRKATPEQRPESLSQECLRKIVLRSCTMAGQLTMFLDRRIRDLQGGNAVGALSRKPLKGLLDFCSKHFHGWFRSELECFQSSLSEGSRTSVIDTLTSMRSWVGTASVSVQIVKLEHGQSFDLVNGGLGQLRVRALNADRGLIPMESISESVHTDKRLKEFIGRLRSICNEFSAALEVASQLSPQLETVTKRLVTAIAKLPASSADRQAVHLPNALITTVDELQDAMADVKRLVKNARPS